jgi:hypothetical protein
VGRRREGVAIVLDDQDQRQLPDGGDVQPLVEVAGRGRPFADEVDGDAVAAALAEGEAAAGRDRDHGAQVADHAKVQDAVLRGEIAVVEGALEPLGETFPFAEELAGQPVEEVLGVGSPAVGVAEAEPGEGAGRVQVDGEDGAEVAVQRAQGVAGPQGQARRDRGGLVAHLAVPLGDAAGEQKGFEAGVEVPRQLHEGIAQPPLLGRVERIAQDGSREV